jgi:hypothetical protein
MHRWTWFRISALTFSAAVACLPQGGGGGAGWAPSAPATSGGSSGGGGDLATPTRPTLPDGDYACTLTDHGTVYPPYLCRITTAATGVRLTKLEGSQRVRGALVILGDDRADFHGEFYCAGGGCDRQVDTHFARTDARWSADLGDGDQLQLDYVPAGMYAGAGYGADAWADDGYRGAELDAGVVSGGGGSPDAGAVLTGGGGSPDGGVVASGGSGDGPAVTACDLPEATAAVRSCPAGGQQRPDTGPPVLARALTAAVDRAPAPGQVVDPKTLPLPAAPRGFDLVASVPSVELEVTEVQGLESLFVSTPKSAAARPKLMRGLALAYRRLEWAAQVEAAAADPAERDRLTQLGKTEAAARAGQITYLALLKNQYPKWCETVDAADPARSRGCIDDALYQLAGADERSGKLADARAVYLELVQSWPQSTFIPGAYFAFGELFFGEAQADPTKLTLAERSYSEVIKYPAPDNALWGAAHHRLARVAWLKGDPARALSELKKTIEFGMQSAAVPAAAALAAIARQDLIAVYPSTGAGKRAFDFVKPLVGSDAAALALLDAMRPSYLGLKSYAELVALDEDLLVREPARCDRLIEVAEVSRALPADVPAIVALAGRLDALASKLLRAHDPAGPACAAGAIAFAAETALPWHDAVIARPDEPTATAAAELLGALVADFTPEVYATATFPRLAVADRPSRAALILFRGQLNQVRGKYALCLAQLAVFASQAPTDPRAPAALDAAARCALDAYDEAHAGRSDRAPLGVLPRPTAGATVDLRARGWSVAEQGWLTQLERQLCEVRPGGGVDGRARRSRLQFARARTYLDAHRWQGAAALFHALALDPNAPDAADAAPLYLEALYAATEAGPGATCTATLAADAAALDARHCAGGARTAACATLAAIKTDIIALPR